MNQAPLKRLGKSLDKRTTSWLCPLEFFTQLKQKSFPVRPAPLKEFTECESLEVERAHHIVQFNRVHESLQDMHKGVAENSLKVRKGGQKMHNAGTRITPVTLHIGDHILIRSNKSQRHKLSPEWVGPMRIIETKFDLVFVAEDLFQVENKLFMDSG